MKIWKKLPYKDTLAKLKKIFLTAQTAQNCKTNLEIW